MIALGFLVETALWGASGGEIQVRIQNYTGVSEKLLAAALTVAESILKSAGVTPVWWNCSLSLGGQMDPECHARTRPAYIQLRLMAKKNAPKQAARYSCMGYAIIPRGDFGSLATVFPERAREKADRSLARRSSVLGHAIAHEIGHLLLGEAKHSGEGLMKPMWSPAELLRASAYPMAFSAREIRNIRQNLRVRTQAALQRNP
jgi:hypothetical protein